MDNYLIKCDYTIKLALQKFYSLDTKVLICVDENNVFKGVLYLKDLLKYLLDNEDFSKRIDCIFNYDYKFIKKDSDSFEKIAELFLKGYDILPILSKENKVLDILKKQDFILSLLEINGIKVVKDYNSIKKLAQDFDIYTRPWGFYKSLLLTSYLRCKIICVFPGHELSLQSHKKREEHWVIVKGKGKVILDESIIPVHKGKYIYIPLASKHKMINDEKENLYFIEVQLGSYFGEDDIIRYEDRYGRV